MWPQPWDETWVSPQPTPTAVEWSCGLCVRLRGRGTAPSVNDAHRALRVHLMTRHVTAETKRDWLRTLTGLAVAQGSA